MCSVAREFTGAMRTHIRLFEHTSEVAVASALLCVQYVNAAFVSLCNRIRSDIVRVAALKWPLQSPIAWLLTEPLKRDSDLEHESNLNISRCSIF